MNLEFKILDHLSKFDNGSFVDITFVDEDCEALEVALNELKGRNLVLLEKSKSRSFEAFGIENKRLRCVRAKINTNGRIYFDSLQTERESNTKDRKRKSWKFAYLFNF
jgi:hypothetical protein